MGYDFSPHYNDFNHMIILWAQIARDAGQDAIGRFRSGGRSTGREGPGTTVERILFWLRRLPDLDLVVSTMETGAEILGHALQDVFDLCSVSGSGQMTRALSQPVSLSTLEAKWGLGLDRYRARQAFPEEFEVFKRQLMFATGDQPTEDVVAQTIRNALDRARASHIRVPSGQDIARALVAAWIRASSVDGSDSDSIAGFISVRVWSSAPNFPWERQNTRFEAFVDDAEEPAGTVTALQGAYVAAPDTSVLNLRLPVRVILNIPQPNLWMARHYVEGGHRTVYAGSEDGCHWDVLNASEQTIDGRTCSEHFNMWLRSDSIPTVSELTEESEPFIPWFQLSPVGRLAQSTSTSRSNAGSNGGHGTRAETQAARRAVRRAARLARRNGGRTVV